MLLENAQTLPFATIVIKQDTFQKIVEIKHVSNVEKEDTLYDFSSPPSFLFNFIFAQFIHSFYEQQFFHSSYNNY